MVRLGELLLTATLLTPFAPAAFAQDVSGIIGGLPAELKAQYGGAAERSAVRVGQFHAAGQTVEVVPLGILLRQSVARVRDH